MTPEREADEWRNAEPIAALPASTPLTFAGFADWPRVAVEAAIEDARASRRFAARVFGDDGR